MVVNGFGISGQYVRITAYSFLAIIRSVQICSSAVCNILVIRKIVGQNKILNNPSPSQQSEKEIIIGRLRADSITFTGVWIFSFVLVCTMAFCMSDLNRLKSVGSN